MEQTNTVPIYRKVPKFLDTYQLYCKHSKNQTKRFYHGVIPLNFTNGKANSEDPDLGLHCLPPAYLYDNLGSLWYIAIYGSNPPYNIKFDQSKTHCGETKTQRKWFLNEKVTVWWKKTE